MPKRVQHPGEVLKQKLRELGVAPSSMAHQISVPPNRISQIIAGKRSVTGDTALRFGHWFGVSPEFWMKLQSHYDLALAEQRIGEAIGRLPTAAEGGSTGADRQYRRRREYTGTASRLKVQPEGSDKQVTAET